MLDEQSHVDIMPALDLCVEGKHCADLSESITRENSHLGTSTLKYCEMVLEC